MNSRETDNQVTEKVAVAVAALNTLTESVTELMERIVALDISDNKLNYKALQQGGRGAVVQQAPGSNEPEEAALKKAARIVRDQANDVFQAVKQDNDDPKVATGSDFTLAGADDTVLVNVNGKKQGYVDLNKKTSGAKETGTFVRTPS